MFACPLGEAAGHADVFAADVPALEFVFADGADGSGSENAPFAVGGVGYGDRFAVDDGADAADAEGGATMKMSRPSGLSRW